MGSHWFVGAGLRWTPRLRDQGTLREVVPEVALQNGLPKLIGGLWHPYRRKWATVRKALPDVDVAQAGGWKGTKAMKLCYQQSTPEGVLAAVMAIGG